MHINKKESLWIQRYIEINHKFTSCSDREKKIEILKQLSLAKIFETFLHKQFFGYKQFSLEGCEVLIPLLHNLINAAAKDKTLEINIGMTHRGRLNVISNILKQSYDNLIDEFYELNKTFINYSGDIKYHSGASNFLNVKNGNKIKINLLSNPSHLESINPVLEGVTRAKHDTLLRLKNVQNIKNLILPVLIHGDAAFSGQGVIYETLNIANLIGYTTGGTIHIIINNQIGFTTLAKEYKSSNQLTDIAKLNSCPIIHVNSDNPEAVIYSIILAYKFRRKFNKDIFIDLICYRKRGHNDLDDPSITQPLMYKNIISKNSIDKIYLKKLIKSKYITRDEYHKYINNQLNLFKKAHKDYIKSNHSIKNNDKFTIKNLQTSCKKIVERKLSTSITKNKIIKIFKVYKKIPKNFYIHPKIEFLLNKKKEMLKSNYIDWSLSEFLAFGSLLLDGISIRLSGQDSCRGTFGQRNAIIYDYKSEKKWIPLSQLSSNKSRFYIYNSPLSEYAIMGFEYGYSIENKNNSLTIWEAQFGDFANGGQVIIDEFIASGFEKWQYTSNITLLLPHGYEGQGPNHSSARIERYLQSCAKNNITIINPSNPASYFHALRMQGLGKFKNPLIIFAPKQLLYSNETFVSLNQIIYSKFLPIIYDKYLKTEFDKQINRLLIVTGRLFYRLSKFKEKINDNATLLIRIEQLYPFPLEEFKLIFDKYKNAKIMYVQEEPENQGCAHFIKYTILKAMNINIKIISRSPSSSTATGFINHHFKEEEQIINSAFQ